MDAPQQQAEHRPPVGRARPGGRTARTRDAVHAATLALLTAQPERELTLPLIAERAGVHASSLYRRWGDVPSLLLEVLLTTADADVAVPDTGDLASDLRALAREVADFHRRGPGLTLLRLATRTDLTGVAGVRERFWATRQAQFESVIARAQARGEVRPDAEPLVVLQLVTAPIHQRLLLSDHPVDAAFLDAVVATVVTGLRRTP